MTKIFYISALLGEIIELAGHAAGQNGILTQKKNFIHAGYNESMTIFDVLAWSKPGCRLTGRFVPAGDLPGTTKSASAPGNLFSRQSGFFCRTL